MSRHRNRMYLLWLSRICGVLAGVIAIAGCIAIWKQHTDNEAANKHATQSMSNSNTGSSDNPSTTKPAVSEFDQYQVPADNPRYLFIPTLAIRAMVKPLGVTAENQLQSPTNVFDVGWYTSSSKPGQSGVTVMAGHVSSWKTHGVFYNLKNLKAGDSVEVQRGDGKTFTYKVVKQQVYDVGNVDMSAVLSPVSQKPGLNLITCGGKVIKNTNNFDKRVVIFTEQL